MYAIVESGGHQYRAEVGKTIQTEKLALNVGETVQLDRVLLIASDEKAWVGTPLVEGAAVQATVVSQIKGQKVRIFKYKPKIRYRVRKGHRQSYTRLRIDGIVGGGLETTAPSAEEN